MDMTIEYRGEMWESKVLELYLLGLNNKEIAAEVYSSPHLIKVTLKRLLGHNYNGDKFLEEHKIVIDQIMDARKSVAVTCHEEELIRKCREKILNIIEVNPHMSRIQIDRLAGRSYTILMKYDREWLNDILPIKKKNPNKLNYELVDQDLSLIVQEVAQRFHYSNPSTQIKKYSILNALVPSDRSRILNHELSLPKTKSMIEKYIESKEAYLLRHVPSIVSQLKASGYRNPTFQSIVAFRRSYRNLPESTRTKIQAKVHEICSF
ncbi:Tn7-like transposition protein D [Paenibacillus sp. FSL R7-269]|nr:Tn7-like transposition protein D [Paenibacillus sp. FSL R7-269]